MSIWQILIVTELSHHLATSGGVDNRRVLHFADGKIVEISGLGAGRFPTATAMFADILEHAAELVREEEDAEPGDRRRA